MSTQRVTAYPWNSLESVPRATARRAARARRQVQAVLDPARLGAALAELTESEVAIIVQRVACAAPRRRPLSELGFELADTGVCCSLAIEPELAANLLARVLRRPITLSPQTAFDDSLSGALQALVLELARRCGARGALHLLDPSEAKARASEVFVEATVLLGGAAYQVLLALELSELPQPRDPREPTLRELGELSIELPVVIGWSLAERAALLDFVPGNAWFPGAGSWLDESLAGTVALAAPGQDRGIAATLSRDGKIVLRGGSVQLLPDAGELMSDPEKPEASLTEAVLDSPVVVRIEVGAVSMTAREWAELAPGDVIESGRRIAEPVVLRVAGREVARGELVNLEGELGVRIRELVRS
ncbi:MAG TPA: FliM/FliN family flagellar motor switch protein [Polyangiaceae bacterium]|nr:FliM/FliN family flagellar motor switch protein [Polyangiaceae bacterium]